MKKELLGMIAFLSSLSLASAASTSFLSEFLYRINQTDLTLMIVFVVSFGIIFFALSHSTFKQNTSIAATIALALSAGITFAANQSGIDFGRWMFFLQIPTDILYTIVPIVFLLIIIVLWTYWGFTKTCLGLGAVLFIGPFTGIISEAAQTGAWIASGVLIFFGIVGWFFGRHRRH